MAYLDYIVGLDIGTTKICAIIAEIRGFRAQSYRSWYNPLGWIEKGSRY